MTDRELLDSAALAAGYQLGWIHDIPRVRCDPEKEFLGWPGWTPWNPLTDDGDALRLAVKLEMDVCFGANYVIVRGSVQTPTVNNAGDPYAATRRAIVRAAAEIGKGMK
jgi:hypothetical protein